MYSVSALRGEDKAGGVGSLMLRNGMIVETMIVCGEV